MADIVQLEEKGTLLYPKTHVNAIDKLDETLVKKTGNETIAGIKNFKDGVQINGASLVNLFYPIGSIYQSTKNTSPSILFGGIWERVANGRTLVAVDENDITLKEAKKIGGSANPLTSHGHAIIGKTYRVGASSGITNTLARSLDIGNVIDGTIANISANQEGNNNNHMNWQPFYTVFMWERIS